MGGRKLTELGIATSLNSEDLVYVVGPIRS